MRNFPTIGEYNQTIQNKGHRAFQSLTNLNFIPSRTFPIKIYSFGSGSYAVVFKASRNRSNYAIRCFLSTEEENINRYQAICSYLNSIDEKWKVSTTFYDKEIEVNRKLYPILAMEWIDGVLINQFVTENLYNSFVLSELQKQLVEISNNLESHNIGHGDLQCGNIIIQKNGNDFQIKLIDYDGMYIPHFNLLKSLENGRSEFQHPKRTESDFSSTIDRFSFWVMLTALEALKHDTTLWDEVMQGGFNTLDNFLFTIKDFLKPNQSALFHRLYRLNSSSLNFYLETLKWLCQNEISVIPPPALHGNAEKKPESNPIEHQNYVSNDKVVVNKISSNKYQIITKNGTASVLTSTFQKLGTTPIELDKNKYNGKMILISNGRETKRIKLDSFQSLIEIVFE